MNAYYEKTFVIGSAFGLDIAYFDRFNKPLVFDPKFRIVDLAFENIKSGAKLELKNIGMVKQNHVVMFAEASAWDNAQEGFYKNDISDSFGYGGAWHAYAVWLRPPLGNDAMCVMRGKAKLVQAAW